MKTAQKPRPKTLKRFLIAFKKSTAIGRYKLLLSLLPVQPELGNATRIYKVRHKVLKKKTKKRIEKLMNASERIILFLGAFFGLIYTLKELFFK